MRNNLFQDIQIFARLRVAGLVFIAVLLGVAVFSLFQADGVHSRSLSDVTPFRPEIVSLLSVKTWANLEMSMALVVIVLSFMQKQYDHSFTHRGILGFFGYVSLVAKVTFAFSVLWDGLFVAKHFATEPPRAIMVVSMVIIIMQQSVHLLYKYATREIVRGHRWPLALIDTVEWAQQSILVVRRARR
jgi:hypothetical protein